MSGGITGSQAGRLGCVRKTERGKRRECFVSEHTAEGKPSRSPSGKRGRDRDGEKQTV